MIIASEIISAIMHLVFALPLQQKDSKRIRIAVTQEEMDHISLHCIQEYGYTVARLGDIPLVVEDNPLSPDLLVEHEDGQSTLYRMPK